MTAEEIEEMNTSDVGNTPSNGAEQRGWYWSFYQHPDDVPGSAQKRFQWCISPHALKEMKRLGLDNAQVLIVVVDKSGHEARQMVPLSSMQAFVQFHKPGPCTVYALAFARPSYSVSPRELRSCYLSKGHRQSYMMNIFSHDSDPAKRKIEVYDSSILFEEVSMEVHVRRTEFAAESPAWLSWWVNLWHEESAVDTCQMRRRLMFSFTLKPFVALLLGITGAVLGAIAFAGLTFIAFLQTFGRCRRGVDWKALFMFHWFDSSRNGDLVPFRNIGSCWLTTDAKGKRRQYAEVFTFFAPAVQILFFVGTSIVLLVYNFLMSTDQQVDAGIFTPVWWSIYGMGALVYLMVALASRQWDRLTTWKDYKDYERWEQKREAREATHRMREEAQRVAKTKRKQAALDVAYSPIVCGDQNGKRARMPEFSLMNPRPALILWFQDIKANFCKPYASQ